VTRPSLAEMAAESMPPRVPPPHEPHGHAPSPPPEDKIGRVLTVADVPTERVTWRWKPYLAAGKLTLVDGDPGDGKSTLTLDLAARYTTGAPMPDGSASDGPGDVLILSAEDGIADTIRPRLEAAGADLGRVHVLHEIEEAGKTRPPDLVGDLDELAAAIATHRIKLVVIDPLMAYLGGGVDSHRDQDVRRVLHPLAKLAEATGAALLVVRHLNKGGGSKAVYRGGGSIGIVGAARLAYLVAIDPDDDTRRVLAPIKLNIASPPSALAYRLVTDEARDVARIQWEGATEHKAGDLLRTIDDEDRTERDEAADWLRDYLTSEGGHALASDVKAEARKAGLAERTLQRARVKVATVETAGFPRRSTWTLRPSGATATPPSQGGTTEAGGTTGQPRGFPADESRLDPQSRQSRHGGEAGAAGGNGLSLVPPSDGLPL
jgi:hypothetical protein